MDILIQGELRSLIRNGLERIIGTNFKKKKNNLNILLQLSIRVVSSLIAVQLFIYTKDNEDIRKYISYIFVGMFILFYLQEKYNFKLLDILA
jgi:hypothetical protein